MSGTEQRAVDGGAVLCGPAASQLLADLAPAVIGVVGPGSVILDIGGAMLAPLGYDAGALRGQPVSAVVPDGEVAALVEAGLRGERGRTTAVFGGRRWRAAVEPVRSGDGQGLVVCVLAYDDEVEVHRELTAREEELEKFAALVELSADFIAMADTDGRVTYLNRAGRDLVGLLGAEDALGRPTEDYFTETGRAKSAEIEAAVLTQGYWEGETELHHFSTGESIPVSANSFLVTRRDDGRPLALATVQRDLRGRIGSEQRLSRLLQEQRGIADLARLALTEPMPVVMGAAVALVTARYPDLISSVFRRTADGTHTQMVAASRDGWEGRIMPLDPATASGVAFAEARTVACPDTVTDGRYADTSPEYGVRSVLSVPIPGTDGPWGMIGAAGPEPYHWTDDDVAFVEAVAATLGAAVHRYALEDRLQHQALHDELTGLPNRALVLDRIEHALAREARANGLLAVLLLDLDDFKTVNDSLGHASGDLLLSELARRLRSAVRPGDTVARLGGDEFVVLCEDLGSEDEVAFVAESLLAACAPAVELAGRAVTLSASIGVALAFDGEGSTAGLLSDADIAMYRAKRDRPGSYRIFDEAMRGDLLGRLNVAGELRAAIRDGELTVAYQPIVDLRSGRVEAFEALARWTTAAGDVVPPDVFIPVAEETGLIGDLGQLVLATAARDAAGWQRVGPVGLRVNVSAHELRSPAFFATVHAALADAGLSPALVGLEITESIFVDEDKNTQENLARLRDSGVSLQIDDFGTGYSSLSYLQRFPLVDVLKIDRSFLGEEGRGEAVVRAVVGLASAFGFRVCAEGVESAELHARVTRLGCDLAQGFYLGRPMSADKAAALLAGWTPLVAG